MLRQRIITALVMAALGLGLLFTLPAAAFNWVILAVLLVGAWEYLRLGGVQPRFWGLLWIFLLVDILVALNVIQPLHNELAVVILSIGCALWLLQLLRMVGFDAGHAANRSYKTLSMVAMFITLSMASYAFAWLLNQPAGRWWLLLLVLIVAAADIGAYFAGKQFGRAKLAPKLSPGKTLAGLYGGLLTAVIVTHLAAWLMPLPSIQAWVLAITAIITALISVAGDLFISMHKRTVGLKDAGSIFPGHGGVLDRFDGLFAAAPFFALCLLLLSR